jgi:hypothetical protein
MTARFAIRLALLICAGCTVINKATFAIEPQKQIAGDALLTGLEDCFHTLGLELVRKTDYFYPEARKQSEYYLGHRELALGFNSTYHHAVLRLELSGVLYVDWIEIADSKRELRPEIFMEVHKKIAEDLKTRLGVDLTFQPVLDAPHKKAEQVRPSS